MASILPHGSLIMYRAILNPKNSYNFLLLIRLVFIIPLLYIISNQSVIIIEAQIFSPSPSQPTISFILDSISVIFIITVAIISFSVLKFSSSYIKTEPFLPRFNSLVLLFILSINFLILIPNIITLLIGWDGLGLISFLLVVYYQNPKSLAAGILTFLTNRLGDTLIISSIIWTMDQANWNLLSMTHSPSSTIIPALIMLAAITKSAQIPFSSWLPAAIAAPTPVSALVHSSTLVTAGVYLLIRFFPFLSSSFISSAVLLILATLTTLIAGLAALYETDIKKIIALSTLRQLGIIIISTALHAPQFTFFHLITHAIFKALLFICAGTMIHSYYNNQDLRMFGNVRSSIPLTSLCISTANLALCGLPFIAGFYSKDLIIELAIMSTSNSLIFILTLFSTSLTAAYSFRISVYTLWSQSNAQPILSISDNRAVNYTYPIILMTSGAIFSGAAINWIFINPTFQIPISLSLKLAPLIVTTIGALTLINPSSNTIIIFSSPPIIKKDFLINMWFLTPLSTKLLVKPASYFSILVTKTNDHGWNELLGPQGLFYSASISSKYIQYTSNSTLNINVFFVVISSLFLIIFFLL